jgi:hypothetical protein
MMMMIYLECSGDESIHNSTVAKPGKKNDVKKV